jgi:hypothetical protein
MQFWNRVVVERGRFFPHQIEQKALLTRIAEVKYRCVVYFIVHVLR